MPEADSVESLGFREVARTGKISRPFQAPIERNLPLNVSTGRSFIPPPFFNVGNMTKKPSKNTCQAPMQPNPLQINHFPVTGSYPQTDILDIERKTREKRSP